MLVDTGLESTRAVMQPCGSSLELGAALAGLSYAQPCFVDSLGVVFACVCALLCHAQDSVGTVERGRSFILLSFFYFSERYTFFLLSTSVFAFFLEGAVSLQ